MSSNDPLAPLLFCGFGVLVLFVVLSLKGTTVKDKPVVSYPKISSPDVQSSPDIDTDYYSKPSEPEPRAYGGPRDISLSDDYKDSGDNEPKQGWLANFWDDIFGIR